MDKWWIWWAVLARYGAVGVGIIPDSLATIRYLEAGSWENLVRCRINLGRMRHDEPLKPTSDNLTLTWHHGTVYQPGFGIADINEDDDDDDYDADYHQKGFLFHSHCHYHTKSLRNPDGTHVFSGKDRRFWGHSLPKAAKATQPSAPTGWVPRRSTSNQWERMGTYIMIHIMIS